MNEPSQATILLVEDEAAMQLALSTVLKEEGFAVSTADDGAKGLASALASHPDMILTDLKMPNMGGIEMIQELRKDAWGKNAEVIILTNMSDVSMLEEAMALNTFQYLIKGDSSMNDIIAKIKARLAAKGKTSAA